MKRIWFSVCLLAGSLFAPLQASAQLSSAEVLLQEMGNATRSLTYELAFINLNPQAIVSVRYRHAIINGIPIAQIMQMDGSRREVVQRGNEISYFEPGLDAFSLSGNHIIDYLPAVIFADFNQLKKYYNFIDVGRTHIGDRPCRVVRITSKDEVRYNYILLIDEETHLPLRIDLLDRDSEALEQFRVVSSTIDGDINDAMSVITRLNMPPMLVIPPSEKVVFNWKVGKLPTGFVEVSRSRRKLSNSGTLESVMFSDGLFSFSVNVTNADKTGKLEYPLRRGARTIYSAIRGANEVTIIGELPLATAKRIVAGVAFIGAD
ncbi:sigma-E factor regulatory protein RseB [Photorhabdus laumondii]|uniref:Sigma-E factor regulatory protein RseB n=1 Tax=Photorhabdus laumondii subsp. clarkei TaxID=2029685 RepID=A0A329VJR9_9GAMM|nr:sigma-E factor regulatory protein RseB [Photorhabdus laumondii]PQQ38487.1 sigma-E factor regulatory protein RseB [Photorhabdus luminescens]RAW92029.1 sigma-E factor regulatory protein RseB [Photorhabdus laumondii subsp. clarkei]